MKTFVITLVILAVATADDYSTPGYNSDCKYLKSLNTRISHLKQVL